MAPELTVETTQFAGSALSGAVPGGPSATDEAAALPIGVAFYYLDRMPPVSAGPAASRADLVADVQGDPTVLPASRLTARARALRGDEARTWAERLARDGGRPSTEPSAAEPSAAPGSEPGDEPIGVRVLGLFETRAAVPVGSTYVLDARGTEFERDPLDWLGEFEPRGPIRKEVAIQLTRRVEGALELAVVVQDLDPGREDERLAAARESDAFRPGPPRPPEEEPLRP